MDHPFEEREGADREQRIQEAFDRAAEELDLTVVPAAAAAGARTVGVAFAMLSKAVDVKPESSPEPVGAADDAEIHKVVTGYESLDPKSFSRLWREYATDPHMGVATGWVGTVDQKAVEHWLESDELAQAEKDMPSHSPRHVKISDVRIVYLGSTRAVATYRVEEEHKNGKTSAGNGTAILMKLEGKGWKIVVVSKGGRAETGSTGK